MAKIKQVSIYNGTEWSDPVDIAVNADDVDVPVTGAEGQTLADVLGKPKADSDGTVPTVTGRLDKLEGQVNNNTWVTQSSMNTSLSQKLDRSGANADVDNTYLKLGVDAVTYPRTGKVSDSKLAVENTDKLRNVISKYNALQGRIGTMLSVSGTTLVINI